MIKIVKKIKFNNKENRMSNVGSIEKIIKNYEQGKNKNLEYLLSKRFSLSKTFFFYHRGVPEIRLRKYVPKKLVLSKITFQNEIR